MFRELVPLMQAGRRRFGGTVTVLDEAHAEQGVRNWMYRRRGAPCLRCGTAIEMGRQGTLKRMVFFCPLCQTAQPVSPKTKRSRRAATGSTRPGSEASIGGRPRLPEGFQRLACEVGSVRFFLDLLERDTFHDFHRRSQHAVVDGVRATADTLNATLQHMKLVEGMRRPCVTR